MDELIRRMKLTDEDRKSLREKRGFTDETIDRLKFRSLPFDFKPTPQEFPFLFHKSGQLFNCLQEKNILIPYLDADGRVYHIRPHKQFIPETSPTPYCKLITDKTKGEVIICESEFKAVALWQLGFNAVGLNGILSFAGKYQPKLLEIVNEYKNKYILFDTEIKDNPRLPTYKQDLYSRFDTEYASYVMGYHLEARIARLPVDWIFGDSGKIDCDTALSLGRTSHEFRKVIDDSVDIYEFMRRQSTECSTVMNKKIKKHFYSLKNHQLSEGWKGNQKNKYVWRENDAKTGEVVETIISNFVIKSIRNFVDDDHKCTREIRFINEFGIYSPPVMMRGEDFSEPKLFKKFCLSCGDYRWNGTKADQVNALQELLEINRENEAEIHYTDKVGEIEPNKWLFDNALVDFNKEPPKISMADDAGIILRDASYGLKINCEAKTKLSISSSTDYLNFNLEKFLELIEENTGTYEATLGVGWIIANIFSNEIFKRYGCFPLLHLCGKMNTGKTFYAKMLLNMIGVDQEGLNTVTSTPKGISRMSNILHSLPLFIDQWKNKGDKDEETYASMYNRQGSIRAQRTTGNETTASKPNSTIILAGEERPTNAALLSRCIVVETVQGKKNFKLASEIYAQIPTFNEWLFFKARTEKDKILETIREQRSYFATEHLDERMATTYAVAVAPLILWGGHYTGELFAEKVLDKMESSKKNVENSHQSVTFWEDLLVLIDQHKLDYRTVCIGKSSSRKCKTLFFRLDSVYTVWLEYYSRINRGKPIDITSLRKYLMVIDFCLGNVVQAYRGGRARCLTFNIDNSNNECIHLIYETIKREMIDRKLDIDTDTSEEEQAVTPDLPF